MTAQQKDNLRTSIRTVRMNAVPEVPVRWVDWVEELLDENTFLVTRINSMEKELRELRKKQ